MGTSADAYIAYGIVLQFEEELPWTRDDDEFSYLEEWWEREGLPEKPFFEISNCGSGDYPQLILIVPRTRQQACLHNPQELDRDLLERDVYVAGQRLKEFCEEHKLPVKDPEPRWYLYSSYSY